MIESTVRLTPDQQNALAIIRQGRRHTLAYGGSRSGKTFLIVYIIILRALMFRESRHLIYRLRQKDAIESIWMETLPKVISAFPGLAADKRDPARHDIPERGRNMGRRCRRCPIG
ncbi:hypothetical protein CCP3SC15_3760002 [Gammaproteobacteria bacterium]